MPVYLVAAYGVFWGLTFALVFSIWARQRRVERELRALQERRDAGEPSR
ncbi:MAG: heme exporter protein CcmD [Anaerolineae bacterium]|jgi:heme exporter protein CcmD